MLAAFREVIIKKKEERRNHCSSFTKNLDKQKHNLMLIFWNG